MWTLPLTLYAFDIGNSSLLTFFFFFFFFFPRQKWEEAEREANKKKSPSGPHKIMIKVVAARNLTAKDKGGTSDPFARIEYGDQAFETKVIYKNLNPRWDEQV